MSYSRENWSAFTRLKFQQDNLVFKGLTELYYAFLLNLLRRHLPTLKIHELSDLPKDDYKNLIQLAKLAARGLEERRYIFTNIPFDTLGLMVSVRKLYDIRAKQPTLYTFLHLTLQEYLAAFYWSQYPHQQPRVFLDSQITNCMSFYMLNSELHRPFCSFFAVQEIFCWSHKLKD